MVDDSEGANLDGSVFRDFQLEIADLRANLEQILNGFDWNSQGTMADCRCVSELSYLLFRFQTLRQSKFGWRDIHGMDEALIARSEALLERYGQELSF